MPKKKINSSSGIYVLEPECLNLVFGTGREGVERGGGVATLVKLLHGLNLIAMAPAANPNAANEG